MSIVATPLAIGGIHREFEQDVLANLIRHKASMHGCPISRVESKLDGSMAIWFKGPRDGVEWEGALRFNFPLLRDKKWLGDVNACVEATLQLLEKIAADKPKPFIQRAQ